jgi:hypothetical protein
LFRVPSNFLLAVNISHRWTNIWWQFVPGYASYLRIFGRVRVAISASFWGRDHGSGKRVMSALSHKVSSGFRVCTSDTRLIGIHRCWEFIFIAHKMLLEAWLHGGVLLAVVKFILKTKFALIIELKCLSLFQSPRTWRLRSLNYFCIQFQQINWVFSFLKTSF